MEIKMKTVSNIAACVGIVIVVTSFVLKMFGVTDIAMSEAVIVGGFVKGVFLPVDVSLWREKRYGKTPTAPTAADAAVASRDEESKANFFKIST